MSASSTEEKASWTEELKGMLIQVLLTIAKDGSFTDNGYTNVVTVTITEYAVTMFECCRRSIVQIHGFISHGKTKIHG